MIKFEKINSLINGIICIVVILGNLIFINFDIIVHTALIYIECYQYFLKAQ